MEYGGTTSAVLFLLIFPLYTIRYTAYTFMEWLIIILLVAILALLVFLYLKSQNKKEDTQGMVLLQNQLQELSRTMDAKLGEGARSMSESLKAQFGESQRLTELVTRQLTEVAREQTKTNESTLRFMTIAEQLANLEKVLKHQKQRGNLGERSLALVLENILPPGTFKMQYAFPGGETVDAVIITKDGMIPIDAKFSLDNYNRVVNE